MNYMYWVSFVASMLIGITSENIAYFLASMMIVAIGKSFDDLLAALEQQK